MSIRSHVRGVIVVTLIGTGISVLFSLPDQFQWRNLLNNMAYCFMIGASLWFGNVSIDPTLDRIFRKKPLRPGQKLVLSLLAMFIISSAIIILVNWFWVYVIWGVDFAKYALRGSGTWIMITEIVVVLIIALVLYTNEFFHSWREAVKNEEALKREKLALEYESLKNQVNPHFLFNSLNSLSGLIGMDDDRATKFVKQLSDIYRYVLEQKDRELVSLDTEMQFVQNYISLMKIRFGDNLEVDTQLDDKNTTRVIPLSIQMLVENAIKHNVVSRDKPLTISISVKEGHYLEVKNNLQKKSSIMKDEEGDWEKHGLANLKSRYDYLGEGIFEVNGSDKEPFPESSNDSFIVKVPLVL